ncbi:MAG: hypothetical protein U5J64_11715 [Halobacteriales archaeon]|nr:hypothetical protein [Halobacteriales archaeon]
MNAPVPPSLEQRVTTARNLRFDVAEERLPDGLELRSGPVVAGSLPEGIGEPIRFTFDVSEDIDSGTYRIPVRVRYDFTRLAEITAGGSTRYRDMTRDRVVNTEFVVEDDARFTLSPANSNVIAGDTGEFAFEVENIGTETAHNPRVVLSSGEGGVFFGGMQDFLENRRLRGVTARRWHRRLYASRCLIGGVSWLISPRRCREIRHVSRRHT